MNLYARRRLSRLWTRIEDARWRRRYDVQADRPRMNWTGARFAMSDLVVIHPLPSAAEHDPDADLWALFGEQGQ